jgi:hypothetical protein
MPTYSLSYLELIIGMSLKAINLRSFGPTIASKIEYFTGAFLMSKDGTVLSIVRVFAV